MRNFKQTSVRNPPRFNGQYVKFTPVANGEGVLELDEAQNAALVAELDRLAERRKLGVVRISKEAYGELLKKKAASLPSPKPRGLFGQDVKVFKQEQTFHNESNPQSKSSPPPASAVGNPFKGTPAIPRGDPRLAMVREDAAPTPTPASPGPKSVVKTARKSELKQPEAAPTE